MFTRKISAIAIVGIMTASAAYGAPDATISADNQAIAAACASDAATAGCGNAQPGHGLMKCLHAYKKATPGYRFSPSCKAAVQQKRADKQAGK